MRELILTEIRRLAEADGGRAPGKSLFTRQTGIREHQWSGVLWARWSDALAEAGFAANTLQARFETADVLSRIIEACRHYQRLPTVAEFKLYRLSDATFPSKGAIAGHFNSRRDLIRALHRRVAEDESCGDIVAMLPAAEGALPDAPRTSTPDDGFVYLIKSGNHHKIGRSSDLERRIKEIRIALPEAAILAHVIRTDDPAGIEAYWHRRFADRRANGEWFALGAPDVAAFKRRKYQ